MALDRGSKPVRIGSVVEFGRNGELHRTIFPPLVDVGISFYPPTVTVTTMGPDGKLILRFGGVKNRKREEVFKSLGWAQPKEIDRLKQTANAARHARKKFEPPPNPMAMEDAHALLEHFSGVRSRKSQLKIRWDERCRQ